MEVNEKKYIRHERKIWLNYLESNRCGTFRSHFESLIIARNLDL